MFLRQENVCLVKQIQVMFTGIRRVMKSMRKYEETGYRWGI